MRSTLLGAAVGARPPAQRRPGRARPNRSTAGVRPQQQDELQRPVGERPTAWISSPRSTNIPTSPRITPTSRLPVTGSRRTHTPSSTPQTGNVWARIAGAVRGGSGSRFCRACGTTEQTYLKTKSWMYVSTDFQSVGPDVMLYLYGLLSSLPGERYCVAQIILDIDCFPCRIAFCCSAIYSQQHQRTTEQEHY